MSHYFRRFAAPLRFLAAAVSLTAVAQAQVPLSGSLSDSTTGPLVSGTIYHMIGNANVPASQTLTIPNDVIIKASVGTQFVVHGTLAASGGTSANPIVFTSIEDDSFGGDTNGNGASSGSPGDWFGLLFNNASDASSLSWVTVRYAGRAGFASVRLSDADITLSNCTIRDGNHDALDLAATTDGASITNCSFLNNALVAVGRVPLQAVPGFLNNSASGNGWDYMEIVNFSHTADLDLNLASCLNGVLVFTASTTVASGLRLTLPAGLVTKWLIATQLVVNGELVSAGTSGQPVILTSYADDAHAGDTNGDGSSSGAPGDWFGVAFNNASDLSSMAWTTVRYAGRAGFASVRLSDADIALSNCTIRDGNHDALDLTATTDGASITNCSFLNNALVAVGRVPLQAVPGFLNNSASGNGWDYMEIVSFSHTANLDLNLASCLNGVLVFTSTMNVASGLRLTLPAGLVTKWLIATQLVVNGELVSAGTSGQPVILTSYADDDHAGDTNGDGVSSGSPGDWFGLQFNNTSDDSSMTWSTVRYSGRAGFASVRLFDTGITLSNCTLRDGDHNALDLTSSTLGASISNCSFLDNDRVAVGRVPLQAVPGFSDNSASGNADGNYMHITVGTIGADVTIGPASVLEGVLVMGTTMSIANGRTLTLEAGVNLKFQVATQAVVNGSLELLGERDAPVVLTSYGDDEIVGDTDLGQVSDAAPGDWFGLDVNPAATASVFRNVVLRYAGRTGFSAVTCDSSLATFELFRVGHSGNNGFDLSAAATAHRLVAWDCALRGIDLNGGSFEVRQASSVGNGTDGIFKNAAYTGTVRDTISWNNSGSNYTGFSAGEVRYSNGSAAFSGSNGNINTDPLFVDEAGGDLHLLIASPCIDAGDPASPLDPDLSRADMGAYFYDYCEPRTYCQSKLSLNGCLPAIAYSGFPTVAGDDDFHVTASDVPGRTTGFVFWGFTPNPMASGVGQLGENPFGARYCVSDGRRGPRVSAGGTSGACNGNLDFHFSQAWMSAKGLSAGMTVYIHFIYEDPGHPDGSGLGNTDALRFQICP